MSCHPKVPHISHLRMPCTTSSSARCAPDALRTLSATRSRLFRVAQFVYAKGYASPPVGQAKTEGSIESIVGEHRVAGPTRRPRVVFARDRLQRLWRNARQLENGSGEPVPARAPGRCQVENALKGAGDGACVPLRR